MAWAAASAAGHGGARSATLSRRRFAQGAAAAAALALGSAALGALGAPGAALADEAGGGGQDEVGGQAAPAGGIDTSTEGEQTYSASDPSWGYELLYVARDGYAVVAGYNKTGAIWDTVETLAVPAELGGLPVLAVGDGAVHGGSFASLDLPASLVAIGARAFKACSSLTSVWLPASVAEVGEAAFQGCSSLASIDVDLENETFAGVDGVLFSRDMTALLAYPAGRPGGSYDVPEGVAEVGVEAFLGCGSLASVRLPESLVSIGDRAFWYCESLTSLELPASVASVGDRAFGNCPSLASIDVDPESAAFADIDGVLFEKAAKRLLAYPPGRPGDAYDVPEGIAEVGVGAFLWCGSLTSVGLPESLVSIGDGAFSGCYSLASVGLPESLVSIGDGAFSGCYSLASVGLPESLVSIGDRAFWYCDSLTSVSLPASVASVGEIDMAFSWCSSLASIDVDPENGTFAGVDGVLFDRDMTALLAYPEGRPGDSYDVPEGVEEIGYFAFCQCESLASVGLPGSLASIGDGAFADCGSLASVTIPASVTRIGDDAFTGSPVTLTVERGSYAARWARDHGADYEYADALDWLQAPGGQDGDGGQAGDGAAGGDQAGDGGTADTADGRLILGSLAR